MIVSDYDLKHDLETERLYVDPIYHDSVRQSGIDFHLGNEIARVRSLNEFDTKSGANSEEWFDREEGLSFVVKPYEKVLCRTIEYMKMPVNLVGLCYLRSTFARLGLFIPPTVIDAGFEGSLTIELFGSSFPIRLHSSDRFMHVIFSRTNSPSIHEYAGRYQGQIAVTLPRMDNRSLQPIATKGGKNNGNV